MPGRYATLFAPGSEQPRKNIGVRGTQQKRQSWFGDGGIRAAASQIKDIMRIIKEMEYAIVLYFDESSEKELNKLIENVSKSTNIKYMVKNKIPPHLTISYFKYDKSSEDIIKEINKNIEKYNSIKLYLISIGVFNPNVIFIAPVMNEELIKINKMTNEIITKNIKETELLFGYEYNQWVPHISIGVKMDKEALVEGFRTLSETFKTMECACEKIALAECNPYKEIKEWKIK
jgi:2'-5' RNA ligase